MRFVTIISLVLLGSRCTMAQNWADLTQSQISQVVTWGITEMYHQQNDVCWKQSFGNGVGVPLICPSNMVREGGICYTPCPPGQSEVTPGSLLCFDDCPTNFNDNGYFCAKPAPKSVGFPVQCRPGLNQEGGLCYSPCPPGYFANPGSPFCYAPCPDRYRDDGLYCAKPASYGRGVGRTCLHGWFQCDCNSDEDLNGSTCYPKCQPGFFAVGCCVCSPTCPGGWADIGVSCTKPSVGRTIEALTYCPPGTNKVGAFCYPPCPSGYHNVGLAICSPDCPVTQGIPWVDIGISCTKPTTTRGTSPVNTCPPNTVRDLNGALCYPPCLPPTPQMIGPVCWAQCSLASYPGQATDCGALCAKDPASCATATVDMVLSPLLMVADILTFGEAAAIKVVADGILTVAGKLTASIINKITKGVIHGAKLSGDALFALDEVQKIILAFENSVNNILGDRLRAYYGNDNAANLITQIAQELTLMIIQDAVANLEIKIIATIDPTGIIDTIQAFNKPICQGPTNPPNIGSTLPPGVTNRPTTSSPTTSSPTTSSPTTSSPTTSSPTTSSPTTSSPAISGDPQFVGLQGQSYQVHGADDTVFNLISYPNLVMNGRFKYIDTGVCNYDDTPCWTHPGTYISAIGLRLLSGSTEIKIGIESGSHDTGLHVFINGKPIHKLKSNVMTQLDSRTSISTHGNTMIQIKIDDLFVLKFTNSDYFLNMEIVCLRADWLRLGAHFYKMKTHNTKLPFPDVPLHGLFGQTWKNIIYPTGNVYEGDIMDYACELNDLYFIDHPYNQYQSQRSDIQ
jgi:hypothetical protein